MKKHLVSFISAFLVFVFFVSSVPASAYAVSVNNTIKDDSSAASSTPLTSSPNVNDLKLASNYEKINHPKSNSYLDDYAAMYVDAGKGHSVNVFFQSKADKSALIDYAYHGSSVIVLAKENNLFCVLYFTQTNEMKAGWISKTLLSTNYPGSTQYIGSAPKTNSLELVGMPYVSWSEEFFTGTKQEFTVLNDVIEDCAAFTLDYQVTARNGAKTDDCLGPRTVYVNDGSGWISVGTFSLNELTPVHVVIYLDKPIDLCAVATSSTCDAADKFIFRQSILDVYTQVK